MIFLFQGIIEPQSTCDVPLVITPQGLEELETTARFIIFGNSESPLVGLVALMDDMLDTLYLGYIMFKKCNTFVISSWKKDWKNIYLN